MTPQPPRPPGPPGPPGPPDDEASAFEELTAEVMAGADRFGHREHIHRTWPAVRRCGVSAAISLVGEGIRRTARYAGAPQKYHATVSRAWVELVGHHATARPADTPGGSDSGDGDGDGGDGGDDFTAVAEHHRALLDKRLLTRFYRPSTPAATQARTGWVEPDLAPFPWKRLT
ncbi:hypothetical protein [Streptomyces sp. NPDC005485]|uniref:hypothetical protein n=1 Tax=Streptomyces sp. NPDC005485 TaxID=3155591 RepID=UPI0033A31277